MEHLARRRFLTLLMGVGAAAACGMRAATPADAATTAAPSPLPTDLPADAAAEATEAELQPDQFYIVRRRRFRRRVYFVRPRRRVYFVRPRRRVYFVRRRYVIRPRRRRVIRFRF